MLRVGLVRFVVLGVAIALAFAVPAGAQAPTRGPAERAGQAVDKAVRGIGDELAEVALAARVRVALLEDLKEAGLRVKVQVHGEQVELSGEVPTQHLRVVAEGAARRVSGVKAVVNGVAVMGSPPPEAVAGRAVQKVSSTLADALLSARVKVRLLDELGRVAFSISVDAASGVVSLSGEVPDSARHTLALKIAGTTSGVSSVVDHLRVPAR